MYYYAHHLGADRNKRDIYKDHKYYQATIDFVKNMIKILLILTTNLSL